MRTADHISWTEKYRPRTLNDFVFQSEEIKNIISQYIKSGNIPNLLLNGIRGTGKSSLAYLLIDLLGVDVDGDVLELNASDFNSVEVIRTTVTQFTKTSPFGDFKIVHLKEADYLSKSAQAALRDVMEQEQHCRFILTCNYIHKIDPALDSRCVTFNFTSPNRIDVITRVLDIAINEKLSNDDSELSTLVEEFVRDGYPDIRKIINNVESHVIDGKLTPLRQSNTISDANWEHLLDMCHLGNWQQARNAIQCISGEDDWQHLYTHLYSTIHTKSYLTDDVVSKGILIIADHLHKHYQCGDVDITAEINATAMLIQLTVLFVTNKKG